MPNFEIPGGEALSLASRGLAGETDPLPGSHQEALHHKDVRLDIRHYYHPLFQIGQRVLQFFRRIKLKVREKNPHIRLEAVLSGELVSKDPFGREVVLQAGQYQLSEHPEIVQLFRKHSATQYFVTHYSPKLLQEMGISELARPSSPRQLSHAMLALIQKALRNPRRDEKMRQLYYQNCIRELMELHLANPLHTLPSAITDKDISAIYAADAFIQENLKVHHPLWKVAQKVELNEYKLKKGFRSVFNCGVFQRLTYHRLQRVKELLQTTTRTLDDIAAEVGFASRNTLIGSFKEHFGITPHKWKKQAGEST